MELKITTYDIPYEHQSEALDLYSLAGESTVRRDCAQSRYNKAKNEGDELRAIREFYIMLEEDRHAKSRSMKFWDFLRSFMPEVDYKTHTVDIGAMTITYSNAWEIQKGIFGNLL